MTDTAPDQLSQKGPCRADVQPARRWLPQPMDFEMPQRRNLHGRRCALQHAAELHGVFLQMLLHEGTFNGAQVLKPRPCV